MKKLLFACDGDNFSYSALELAANMNKQEKILLKGAFLPSIDYSRMGSFTYANSYTGFIPPDFYEREEETMNRNIRQFEDLCKENNISYNINKYTNFESLQGLLGETRFSDMILIGSEHFFSAMGSDQPNAEMIRLLHDTECPAFLIPDELREPESILFAYDGESACMAALKQFSRLMISYTDLPLTVVFFSFSHGERLPYEDAAKEYIKCHFKDFTVKVEDSGKIKDLDEWIEAYPNPLIITGAYSRSGFSRIFKKSFISTVIANHQFPVFLFHGK